MRRLALFALLLAALSLSTAFAASFDVQAEDVQTYDTAVSITVPAPTPFPSTIFITGPDDVPGALTLEPVQSSNLSALIQLGTLPVETQSLAGRYFTWQTPSAPPGGWKLEGSVKMFMDQKPKASDRMTAGLFSCPAAAPAATTTCTLIDVAVGGPGANANSNGFQMRTVDFGSVPTTVIPAGHQLRLKIVSVGSSSTGDFEVQFGNLSSENSQLVITPP